MTYIYKDYTFVGTPYNGQWAPLFDGGIIYVYMYDGGFNHSKILVADDIVSTCGSTNVDFRSFENNFESNIFFYQREMALRMKALFVADMEQCTVMEAADSGARGGIGRFLLRLWESLVRLLSPLL